MKSSTTSSAKLGDFGRQRLVADDGFDLAAECLEHGDHAAGVGLGHLSVDVCRESCVLDEEAAELGFQSTACGKLLRHFAAGYGRDGEVDEQFTRLGIDRAADGDFVQIVDHLGEALELRVDEVAAQLELGVAFVGQPGDGVAADGREHLGTQQADAFGHVLHVDLDAQIVLVFEIAQDGNGIVGQVG